MYIWRAHKAFSWPYTINYSVSMHVFILGIIELLMDYLKEDHLVLTDTATVARGAGEDVYVFANSCMMPRG